MKLDGKIFSEPLLEFGDQHSHADPRLGLMEAGPLQTHLGDAIQVGVVGTEQTIELAEAYFAEAGDGYEGKSE
jgi:hypothetical protein